MATTTLYLDGDVTTNWDTSTGGNHYGEIDEGTDSPSDADYIQTTTLTDDDRFTFGASPSNLSECTQIILKTRCGITDASDAAYIRCQLWHTTSTQIGSDQDITCVSSAPGAQEVLDDGTLATISITFGSLTLTKAQVDSLEVEYTFNST